MIHGFTDPIVRSQTFSWPQFCRYVSADNGTPHPEGLKDPVQAGFHRRAEG
jgi:hypothetical protein